MSVSVYRPNTTPIVPPGDVHTFPISTKVPGFHNYGLLTQTEPWAFPTDVDQYIAPYKMDYSKLIKDKDLEKIYERENVTLPDELKPELTEDWLRNHELMMNLAYGRLSDEEKKLYITPEKIDFAAYLDEPFLKSTGQSILNYKQDVMHEYNRLLKKEVLENGLNSNDILRLEFIKKRLLDISKMEHPEELMNQGQKELMEDMITKTRSSAIRRKDPGFTPGMSPLELHPEDKISDANSYSSFLDEVRTGKIDAQETIKALKNKISIIEKKKDISKKDKALADQYKTQILIIQNWISQQKREVQESIDLLKDKKIAVITTWPTSRMKMYEEQMETLVNTTYLPRVIPLSENLKFGDNWEAQVNDQVIEHNAVPLVNKASSYWNFFTSAPSFIWRTISSPSYTVNGSPISKTEAVKSKIKNLYTPWPYHETIDIQTEHGKKAYDETHAQWEKHDKADIKIDSRAMQTVKNLWDLCYKAYKPSAKDPNWEYNYFSYEGENAGFIAIQKDKNGKLGVVIAHRGTQNEGAIWEDLASMKVVGFKEYCGVKIDGPLYIPYAPGIRLKAFEPYFEPLINYIISHPDDFGELIIIGHSLGGGTAQGNLALLASVIEARAPFLATKIGGMPFESMRGLAEESYIHLMDTNEAFRVINSNVIRWANVHDIVTNVPFRASGFVSIGNTVASVPEWLLVVLGTTPNPALVFDPNIGTHSYNITSRAVDMAKDFIDNPKKRKDMLVSYLNEMDKIEQKLSSGETDNALEEIAFTDADLFFRLIFESVLGLENPYLAFMAGKYPRLWSHLSKGKMLADLLDIKRNSASMIGRNVLKEAGWKDKEIGQLIDDLAGALINNAVMKGEDIKQVTSQLTPEQLRLLANIVDENQLLPDKPNNSGVSWYSTLWENMKQYIPLLGKENELGEEEKAQLLNAILNRGDIENAEAVNADTGHGEIPGKELMKAKMAYVRSFKKKTV